MSDVPGLKDEEFEDVSQVDGKEMLQLVLMLDTTSSMMREIAMAQKTLVQIVETVSASAEGKFSKVQVAAVFYRDYAQHSPLVEYVVDGVDFTTDVDTVVAAIQNTKALGGGDTPEAVDAALMQVRDLSWDDNASTHRVLVSIADAPPHKLGSSDDWFLHKNLPPFRGIDKIEREPEDIQSVLLQLREKGIKYYPLVVYKHGGVATGTPEFFQQAASLTHGRCLRLDTGFGSKVETDNQEFVSIVTGLIFETLDKNNVYKKLDEATIQAAKTKAANVYKVTIEKVTDEQLSKELAKTFVGTEIRQLHSNDIETPMYRSLGAEAPPAATVDELAALFKDKGVHELRHSMAYATPTKVARMPGDAAPPPVRRGVAAGVKYRGLSASMDDMEEPRYNSCAASAPLDEGESPVYRGMAAGAAVPPVARASRSISRAVDADDILSALKLRREVTMS